MAIQRSAIGRRAASAALIGALLLLWGCGGGNTTTGGNTEAQKQALNSLQQQLQNKDALRNDSSTFGMMSAFFATAFAFMPTNSSTTPTGGYPTGYPTGLPAGTITQPLGEECVTESGTTVTFNCPTVTGSVSFDGDTTNINLKITGGMPGMTGVGSMLISGYTIDKEGYRSGHLYFEFSTSSGAGSMTVDYEVFEGACANGWVTFTWGGANPMGSAYKLVRVTFDCNSFNATYE